MRDRWVLAATAAVAACVLGGCGLDKADEHARQLDVIGDMEIATTFCTSGDANRDSRACGAYDRPHRGQALVAYRVPDGSDAPAGLDDDRNRLRFSPNESYTEHMQVTYPEAGTHWAGYVSNVYSVAAGAPAAFTVSPPFTLPGTERPFAGPFRYRVEGGYRELLDQADDGSAAIDCEGDADTVCTGGGTDSQQATRDLGVLAGAADGPAVVPGGHVSVPFTLRFAGAGGEEARFSLATSTDLDGARAVVGRATLSPAGDSDNPVPVELSVPADAAEGTYQVRLTATVQGDTGPIIHAAQTGAAQQRSGVMTVRVVKPEPDEPAPQPVTPAPAPAEPDREARPPALAVPEARPPGARSPSRRAKLRVSLSALPRRAWNGDYASYLVVTRNASGEPAIGTRVCETLPGRVQFVQASRRVRFRGGRVCFDRARLAARRSVVALVYVHLDTDARAGLARARATAIATNAARAGARANLRVLRRAAVPRQAPVTG